jgi:hypothetical protein
MGGGADIGAAYQAKIERAGRRDELVGKKGLEIWLALILLAFTTIEWML